MHREGVTESGNHHGYRSLYDTVTCLGTDESLECIVQVSSNQHETPHHQHQGGLPFPTTEILIPTVLRHGILLPHCRHLVFHFTTINLLFTPKYKLFPSCFTLNSTHATLSVPTGRWRPTPPSATCFRLNVSFSTAF